MEPRAEAIPAKEGPPDDPEPPQEEYEVEAPQQQPPEEYEVEAPQQQPQEEYEVEAPHPQPRDDDDHDGVASTGSTTNGSNGATFEIKTVPWMRQLSTILWYKNLPLLQRKPIHLFLMIFSSVASSLLAWAGGKDYDDDDVDFGWPPLTECGTIEPDYFDDLDWEAKAKVPLSLNDSWRSGLPVAILSLGPMLSAICVFLLVHGELELQMLGVLRGGLGLRDSVYWMGWFLPFALLSLINSFLGAFTAKMLPVHVFDATYFGGICGSLFFLQLALIGSALFLAAVLGQARRGAVWIILIMVGVVWVPMLMIIFQSSFDLSASFVTTSSDVYTPLGLFWVNRQTSFSVQERSDEYLNSTSVCDYPILSEAEGTFFKTSEERKAVGPENFFVGCYAAAGWGATQWSPTGKTKLGLAVIWFFPYFHFQTIWGNFAGYTATNKTEFNANHASMNTAELAREALPVPPSESNSQGTTLFPQGSMLQLDSSYTYECEEEGYGGYCEKYKNNCPAQDMEGFNFCSNIDYQQCQYAPNPSPAEGKSVYEMFGMLLALSLVYLLMAVYWGIVFFGGPGTHPFYFIFQKTYWFGAPKGSNSRSGSVPVDAEVGMSEPEAAVNLYGLRKQYGTTEAVSDVSMQLAKGEVTAILGHNGAGKTTLVNVLTCEVRATSGDITVFGHSVSNDPYKIRQLVGICKQDDYLYPSLSANEQLSLYAGLRGVDPEEIDETVQKWLESVDLDSVQHQYSGEFSGGMKRRLSLALSTIGGRPVIVLDEPTTGMDPVSRRYVWKHIDSIKRDRVVLLTTHAMEEADLLADMVAIMRKGKLAAWGSPLELKAEHASALQFAFLVDKENATKATGICRTHFEDSKECVKIVAGDSGNITVTILSIQQTAGQIGVPIDVLTNFVAWLDDPESGVNEYGFSNSSLEEVFLKVTEGDVEQNPEIPQEDDQTINSELDARLPAGSSTNVQAYTPSLTVSRQTQALVWQNLVSTWTGRRSLGSWLIYSMFIAISTILGVKFAATPDKIPGLSIQVGFLSFILMNICSSIYGDRSEGLFYLMRTQGLLKTSYLLGTCLYALIISAVYAFVMLALLYATPMLRDPSVCVTNWETNEYCDVKFGDTPIVTQYEMVEVPYEGEFGGQPVSLYAYLTPGGIGKLLGAGFVFALTMPGAVLASSYLPGYKFALVMISFLAIGATITPVVIYFTSTAISSEQKVEECFDADLCSSVLAAGTVNEDFLDCIGFRGGRPSSLCIPSYAGLLPQFGFFQMLSMTMVSKITFFSETPGFVEQVFIPSVEGGECSSNSCTFPYANNLYGKNAGWEIIGAVILLVFGILCAHVFTFPVAFILRMKSTITQIIEVFRCRRKRMHGQKIPQEHEEFEEVVKERETVEAIVHPFLSSSSPDSEPVIANHSELPRDDLPPLVMHKLCKVFPSFGRLPPKVALKSLDLHVPKGQVLGFLGKNGAGKTTALKILSGAHDATSGIGLLAGYDVGSERIDVFERLGNCPQFDIVWKEMTVKEHLVFFAKLKGLPRKNIQSAARSIATAVGLGATEVYNRRAQALSGGMRRRLSIAISLIGAPSVLLCDEPSTGLDPSTRNNIWNLVNSFATEERAIVITTHMMLEADTLCNRIAIISKGELVVCASQQRLKDRFGSGYLLQLNLAKATPENQEEVMVFARKHLHKGATLQTKQAKTLHVNLPRDLDLKNAFASLYDPEVRPSSVNQFLLSQSSLEDVFIALGDK